MAVAQKTINAQGMRNIYLERSASFFGVINATVKKELIMKFRYKADLIGQMIRMVLYIGVFSLFATAYVLGDFQADTRTTLLFFIAGFMLIVYDGVTLWTPLNAVTNDLYNGTLEYLYSSPNSRLAYYLGTIIAAAIFNSVIQIPIILFAVIYYKLSLLSLCYLLLVLTAALTVLIAFGTMFALLGVMFRQVSSIAGILNMLFQFLGGFLFPIQALPKAVEYVSYSLPYTWAIDLMRYYLMDGWTTLLPVPIMWTILMGQGLLLWILVKKLIGSVEKYSKKNGLHLI